jgi:hypothetical protein
MGRMHNLVLLLLIGEALLLVVRTAGHETGRTERYFIAWSKARTLKYGIAKALERHK